MLMALVSLLEVQTQPRMETGKKTIQLLNYSASHPKAQFQSIEETRWSYIYIQMYYTYHN